MKKLFPLTTFQQDAVLKRLKELQEGIEDIVGINYEVDESSISTLTSNNIEDFLDLKHKVIKWRLNTTSNYYYVYVLNASKSTNQPYMYKLTLVGVGENYGMIVDFTQQALTTISSDRIVNIGTLRPVTPNVPTSSGDSALTSLKVGSTNYKIRGGTKWYKHEIVNVDEEFTIITISDKEDAYVGLESLCDDIKTFGGYLNDTGNTGVNGRITWINYSQQNGATFTAGNNTSDYIEITASMFDDCTDTITQL